MPAKGFLDLPGEIRNHIYRFSSPEIAVVTTWGEKHTVKHELWRYLTTKTAITPVIQERGGDITRRTAQPLPILHLNRTIRAEALAIMYKETTFATNILPRDCPSKPSGAITRNKEAHDHFFLPSEHRSPDHNSEIPAPFLVTRNWLLTLHWGSNHPDRSSQALDIQKVVLCIVEMLKQNKDLENVKIEYPCWCSMKPPARLTPRDKWLREAMDNIFTMVGPMAALRVKEKAVYQPLVFKVATFLLLGIRNKPEKKHAISENRTQVVKKDMVSGASSSYTGVSSEPEMAFPKMLSFIPTNLGLVITSLLLRYMYDSLDSMDLFVVYIFSIWVVVADAILVYKKIKQLGGVKEERGEGGKDGKFASMYYHGGDD
ncbi:MAG: hypothetical protein LQ350_003545 [Teloschistes chrysophthalmus]|nr:MAG: hypothetical protein LQ350_003545 [Niorma chrysophthalma]